MHQQHPIILVAALCGALSYGAAEARVYRCTDADGKIAYSQVPCPTDQQSDTMRLGSKPRQDKDLCRLARELAIKTYADIRAGRDAGAVMDEYGGVDYITPATLSVINFAAGFRYNDDLEAARVGALAYARCREGGFGPLSPGDLPEPSPLMGDLPVRGPAGYAPSEPIGAAPGTVACDQYQAQLKAVEQALQGPSEPHQTGQLQQLRALLSERLTSECAPP